MESGRWHSQWGKRLLSGFVGNSRDFRVTRFSDGLTLIPSAEVLLLPSWLMFVAEEIWSRCKITFMVTLQSMCTWCLVFCCLHLRLYEETPLGWSVVLFPCFQLGWESKAYNLSFSLLRHSRAVGVAGFPESPSPSSSWLQGAASNSLCRWS